MILLLLRLIRRGFLFLVLFLVSFGCSFLFWLLLFAILLVLVKECREVWVCLFLIWGVLLLLGVFHLLQVCRWSLESVGALAFYQSMIILIIFELEPPF